MSGHMYIDGPRIYVRFRNDALLREKFKSDVYGRNWDNDRKEWWVGLNFLSVYQLFKFADAQKWIASPELKQAIKDAQFRQKWALSSADGTDDRFGDMYDERLYPFQRASAMYAINEGRCLIADHMGLGKTPISLIAARERGAYPLLIVCPAVAKYKWAEEVERWLGETDVRILDGLTPEVTNNKVVIMNYEILRGWVYIEDSRKKAPEWCLSRREWSTIILDESHRISNSKTLMCKAALKLGTCKTTKTRLCLTGTPYRNRPKELITQLRFLGRTEELGLMSNFRDYFCWAPGNAYVERRDDGARNLNDLNALLRCGHMTRHRKKDVLTQLPVKQRCMLEVDIDAKSSYARAEQSYVNWTLATGFKSFEQKAEEMSQLNKLRLSSAEGKLMFAKEWIDEFIEGSPEEDKLIVWAYHHEIQDKLIAMYPDAPCITHHESMKKREENRVKFQTDPTCRIIICSMMAAKEAIDLYAANNELFLEFPWTSSDLDQMEDRAHRIGQTRSVNIYYMVGKDTVDDDQMAIIDEKRRYQQEGLDGIIDHAEYLANVQEASRESVMVQEVIKRLLMRRHKESLKKYDVTVEGLF